MMHLFLTKLQLAFLASCLALLAIPGCITGRNETVVERSAPSRPAWANGDYSEEGTSVVFMNFVRTEVYRLELGLKQAQLAAIHDTKELLIARAKQELVAKSENLYKASRKDVESGIERAAVVLRASPKFKPNDGTPRTVYWEQVNLPTSEGTKNYYNVYVLLTVPRDQLDNTMLLLLNEMQKQTGAPQQFANTVINESRQ